MICFISLVPGLYVGEAIGGDGPLSGLIMLLFPPGTAAALVWLILSLRRRVFRATTVLISPVGVHARDHRGLQMRMRWEDITSIVHLQGGRAPTLLARAVGFAAREIAALGQPIHPSAGLIGWGTRVLPAEMPRREAEVVYSQRRDPATGRYEIAIPFSLAGPVNPHNRLVANTWHYRPDLFPPPPGAS
ncbi:hypothetical protein [Nonomuraea sp. SYSU D8015]|uniref:hypothetical protein n=1 Tax=Nonomuraea sp. SYSU D8015 TaxID=2593644 RepID=UPI0016614236|nr:hypothetical protein [Nonomuraea sp. SYSU D8015]